MSLSNVYDYTNLKKAGVKCCRAGRWKGSIQNFEMCLVRNTAKAKKLIEDESFNPSDTMDFEITERGKKRLIRAHNIRDRQVYKSFCDNELKPVIANYILDHNNASQIGKGTDKSIKEFRKGLAHAYKKYKRDFYVITYDYSNYFGTLRHDVIKDIPVSDDTKWLLDSYVDLFHKLDGTYQGIGIGGEPSQDISVVYASKINRMLACNPKVLDAGWYMDDGYVITHTKNDARNILTKIVAESDKLGLIINWKRTKINWMEKDSVIWLKKRTRLTESGKIIMKLTRKNIQDEKKRIKEYTHLIDNGKMPQYAADMSIACWTNYVKPYNSNESMLRLLHFYGDIFDIPWDKMKILLRRHQKGWIGFDKSNLEALYLNNHWQQ